MEAVEEALLDDFDQWLNENGKTNDGERLEDQLDEFMKEKYAMRVATENIFETIKAMNSPPPSSEEESKSGASSAVLQNLVACAARDGQSEMSSRKKRSNEGEAFALSKYICIKLEETFNSSPKFLSVKYAKRKISKIFRLQRQVQLRRHWGDHLLTKRQQCKRVCDYCCQNRGWGLLDL